LYSDQPSTSEIRAQLSLLERRTGELRLQTQSVVETSAPSDAELVDTLSELSQLTKPDMVIESLDELTDLTQCCLVSVVLYSNTVLSSKCSTV